MAEEKTKFNAGDTLESYIERSTHQAILNTLDIYHTLTEAEAELLNEVADTEKALEVVATAILLRDVQEIVRSITKIPYYHNKKGD